MIFGLQLPLARSRPEGEDASPDSLSVFLRRYGGVTGALCQPTMTDPSSLYMRITVSLGKLHSKCECVCTETIRKQEKQVMYNTESGLL